MYHMSNRKQSGSMHVERVNWILSLKMHKLYRDLDIEFSLKKRLTLI